MIYDQLTIVIPTHERHNLLLRSVDYYTKLNVSVIIVDSSVNKLERILPSKFQYIHMPCEEFGNKIYKALLRVTTEYSCLSADDDFLSESGLVGAVEFLEVNGDYISAQGRYISFDLKDGNIICAPMYTQKLFYKVDDVTRIGRIKQAFNPYMHHIYSVHRTRILIKSFLAVSTIKSTSPVELNVALVGATYGKHMLLPMFWMARDQRIYTSTVNEDGKVERVSLYNAEIIPVTLVVNNWATYFSTTEGQLYKKNYCSVINDIVKNNEEQNTLFDAAFSAYNSRTKKNDYSCKLKFKTHIRRVIKKLLPYYMLNIYRLVRDAYFRYKYPLRYPSAKEWERIKGVILKHDDKVRSN